MNTITEISNDSLGIISDYKNQLEHVEKMKESLERLEFIFIIYKLSRKHEKRGKNIFVYNTTNEKILHNCTECNKLIWEITMDSTQICDKCYTGNIIYCEYDIRTIYNHSVIDLMVENKKIIYPNIIERFVNSKTNEIVMYEFSNSV